jgi:pyruvate formate lyase activating enzyme
MPYKDEMIEHRKYTGKGLITDIQRMSVHDGPGIRTTVFLKGCNMRCAWCHNPETVKAQPEYVFNPKLCRHCGYCDEGCYCGAKKLCGREVTAEYVIDQALLDKPYYGNDGGITISGGEPLVQPDFVLELCKLAREHELHIGIETNLSMPYAKIAPLVAFADLWMVDIKAFSDEIHQKYTGISNAGILKNINLLDQNRGVSIVIRTPAVPGVNDSYQEIEKILKFTEKLEHLEYYELLPYHPLGLSKLVEDTGFITRFENPDKKNLRKTLERLREIYSVDLRMANVKIRQNGGNI